jgi:hypothetical protein
MIRQRGIAMFNCDVLLKGTATSDQLQLLGAALWRLAHPVNELTGMYQLVDNQALADLIGGRFPPLSQRGLGNVHVVVPATVSHDRERIIDSLLKAIPVQGVERILVDGMSWNPRSKACSEQPDRQPNPEAAA